VALVVTDKLELPAAITKAHEEAQARQATPAPAQAAETQPGLGGPAASRSRVAARRRIWRRCCRRFAARRL
jgi:hypothetical protein